MAYLLAALLLLAPVPPGSDWVLYFDPSGRFSMSYPRGWQVREDPVEGSVAFVRDSLEEGTSFSVFPRRFVQGDPGPEATAREVLTTFAGLGQYPNLRVRQRVEHLGSGIYSVRGEARWTSASGQALRAVFVCVLARPPVHGFDTQVFYLLLGRAPDREWSRWEATLTRMLREFRWLGG